MGTIYTWEQELAADATGAAADITLVYDASAKATKRITLANLGSRALGASSSATLGFYGATAVDQGTFTATAITALATATISAANAVGVFGFASSTVAAAYAKRLSQVQADIETLMGKIDSTGLVSIAGV